MLTRAITGLFRCVSMLDRVEVFTKLTVTLVPQILED